MPQCTLLKYQKNEVFELIKESSLDPFNFFWNKTASSRSGDTLSSDIISKLEYKGSDFYFLFDFLRKAHYAEYSPGNDKLVDEYYPGAWKNQQYYVQQWLSFLKREIDQPDLWAQLSEYQFPREDQLSRDMGNEPFTAFQVDQIVRGIDLIKTYLIAEIKIDSDQKKETNERLDYLIEAAKRQGRKDWIHTAIGVIFTLAVSLSLSPEQAKSIWGLLKSTMSGIIKFLPY
jgi:hypothetical protein